MDLVAYFIRSRCRWSTIEKLGALLDANPDLAKGHRLKESFQRILAERDIEGFDAWLQKAAQSGLKPFEGGL